MGEYPRPSVDRPTGNGLIGQVGHLPAITGRMIRDGTYWQHCYEAHLRYLAEKSMLFKCNYCVRQFFTKEDFNTHFERCPIRIANGYISPETPEEEMLVLTDEELVDEFCNLCWAGRNAIIERREIVRAELLKRLGERL